MADRLRPIYAVRPGATGDISLQGEQTSNDWIAWCQPAAAPYNPSTLVYQGNLYVLYDNGSIACFNARDGSSVYARQRIPKGGSCTTSPWAYDGKIFCLNEDGVTFVLKAGGQPGAGVEKVLASELRRGDLVVVVANEIIPGDGDVVDEPARRRLRPALPAWSAWLTPEKCWVPTGLKLGKKLPAI